MSDDVLLLEGSNGPTALGPDTLLFAMDETGHERFADPNYPVFGLGGCAVMVRSYDGLVRQPWAALKQRHFAGPLLPLHAADMGQATPDQREAVGQFFRDRHFARFAAVATIESRIEDPFRAVAQVVAGQLARIAQMTTCTRVALLVEDSQRTRGLTADVFADFGMLVREPERSFGMPISRFFGSKSLCEPALEVADFVIQAAGGAVKAKAKGTQPLDRKDFAAVFGSVPKHLALFLHLTSVRSRQGDAASRAEAV